MKTPDDIKKGIVYCINRDCAGEKCPYYYAKSCNSEKSYDELAYIQQLESSVPRWISVEEKLPEDVVDVLLFVRFGPECKIQFGWHIEDEWHDYDGNIYGEVTHWMPLPEPPKEERNTDDT